MILRSRFFNQLNAELHRTYRLIACHRRSACEIRRAGAQLAVTQAGCVFKFVIDADVDDFGFDAMMAR